MHNVHRIPNNSKYVIILFYDVLNSEILQVIKIWHTFLLYWVIKTQIYKFNWNFRTYIQGDHLEAYLKQTLASNMYWKTQWNNIYRSNTQGGSFYVWRKPSRYFEGLTYRTCWKLHAFLRASAAGLDVRRLWLFFPGQSGRRTKDVYRRLQPRYAIDLHFIYLNELRNKGTVVKHEEVWPAGRPWSCSWFRSRWRPSNLERRRLMIGMACGHVYLYCVSMN